MPYIIDGHNLIPKIPGLRLDAVDDEQQLVALLQEFCRVSRKQVEVYFDNAAPGQAGMRKAGLVAVHFVRSGRTADDAIRERLVKMKRSAKNWSVVSSDQSVQAAARQAGAQALSAEAFAAQLRAALGASNLDRQPSSDQPLSSAEVDEWLKLFQSKRNP
jgi:hypothetical protein